MKRSTFVFLMILLVSSITLVTSSCTENQRARTFGGTMVIDLPAGEKVVNATWKESDLWILTRKFRADEQSETYYFREKSSFGILEGTITIIEHGHGISGIQPITTYDPPDLPVLPRAEPDLK